MGAAAAVLSCNHHDIDLTRDLRVCVVGAVGNGGHGVSLLPRYSKDGALFCGCEAIVDLDNSQSLFLFAKESQSMYRISQFFSCRTRSV